MQMQESLKAAGPMFVGGVSALGGLEEVVGVVFGRSMNGREGSGVGRPVVCPL